MTLTVVHALSSYPGSSQPADGGWLLERHDVSLERTSGLPLPVSTRICATSPDAPSDVFVAKTAIVFDPAFTSGVMFTAAMLVQVVPTDARMPLT